MPTEPYKSVLVFVSLTSLLICDVNAAPSQDLADREHSKRDTSGPLILDYGPSLTAEEGPPIAVGALRDPAYLPAQIGGIVGSYAFVLVLIAITLLSLAKRRREHLQADADDDDDIKDAPPSKEALDYQYPLQDIPPFKSQDTLPLPYSVDIPPRSPIANFSYPTPISPTRTEHSAYIYPSPTSSYAPGVDFSVDQSVVARDRQMAQSQLEEMYRYVMEQEAAKEAGTEGPSLPYSASTPRLPAASASTSTLVKKERVIPASLNLNREEKTQSRASSILSVLKSPRRKKAPQALSISSPIMTPMTATFPRESEDTGAIPPRHYAPPPPPPIPTDQVPYQHQRRTIVQPLMTPETSPQSTMSIDERLGTQLGPMESSRNHARQISSATYEGDPSSAASEVSTSPLVGLPSSPKPSVTRFPGLVSLPSSPKPGATFQRSNAPSAVRTGGALPLRAYEPSLASPSLVSHQVKQTTFERSYPLSPGGGRTPMTGMAVPYTPYQPFSPVIPMTPSLVTRADRKRMRKLEPKTPTTVMVKGEDEIW